MVYRFFTSFPDPEENKITFPKLAAVYFPAIAVQHFRSQPVQLLLINLLICIENQPGTVYSRPGISAIAVGHSQPASKVRIQLKVIVPGDLHPELPGKHLLRCTPRWNLPSAGAGSHQQDSQAQQNNGHISFHVLKNKQLLKQD